MALGSLGSAWRCGVGLYGLVWCSREQGGGVALDAREQEGGVVGSGVLWGWVSHGQQL